MNVSFEIDKIIMKKTTRLFKSLNITLRDNLSIEIIENQFYIFIKLKYKANNNIIIKFNKRKNSLNNFSL